MGDFEIEGKYYEGKRRKTISTWVKPEKEEIGVVIRDDRGEPYMVVPLDHYCLLLSLIKDSI